MSADDLRVRTALAYALIQPCIVCHGTATTAGMFLPDAEHTHVFGGHPDRQRVIFYALCEECYCSPTRDRDAEDAILRGVRR